MVSTAGNQLATEACYFGKPLLVMPEDCAEQRLNARQVENKLLKIVERKPGTQHLVVVFSSVNLVDSSGLEMLERVNANLRASNVTCHLAEVKHGILKQFEAVGFLERLSGEVFFSTDEAVRTLAERESALGI